MVSLMIFFCNIRFGRNEITWDPHDNFVDKMHCSVRLFILKPDLDLTLA